MSIEVLRASVTRLGSQTAVAKQLGISRQRLNNWLKAGKLPSGWDFGLAERLKANGRGAKKNGA
jgi:hypothetical protein